MNTAKEESTIKEKYVYKQLTATFFQVLFFIFVVGVFLVGSLSCDFFL